MAKEKNSKTLHECREIINKNPHVLDLLSEPYKQIATALFKNQNPPNEQ